jgi:hypothetical protein
MSMVETCRAVPFFFLKVEAGSLPLLLNYVSKPDTKKPEATIWFASGVVPNGF